MCAVLPLPHLTHSPLFSVSHLCKASHVGATLQLSCNLALGFVPRAPLRLTGSGEVCVALQEEVLLG